MTCGVALAALVPAFAGAVAADRPVIRAASALPPSRFTLSGPPSAAFLGDAFLTETVPALRAEAERVRATYSIADTALADRLRTGLAVIAVLQRRPADAAVLIAESRAAATKPQQRAIGMLLQDALAASARPDGTSDCAAGAARIAALLAANDPAVIRDEALQRLTQIAVVGPRFLSGTIAADLDTGVAARGGANLVEGLQLALYRLAATMLPPCRDAYSGAIRRWIALPTSQPTDIWAARQPAASVFAAAKPVTVAIWDSGYDPALFGGQLAIDPAEPLDGRDNDGNGVVDDWNGPTYGYRLEPIAAPLPPPSRELAPQLAFQMALQKGTSDLRFGYDTPEAALFAARSRDAGPADQMLDALLWAEMGGRNHGTEVASEIADGAPFVRLYTVFALPFGDDPRPVPIDEPQMDRWVRAIAAVGPRMRGAGVRIVNLSWGISADELSEKLIQTGSETDQARAVTRGTAMFARAEAALRRLVTESPDILFVVSAGNSNQTSDILAAAPQAIVAPNLIVVGASGTNGRPTGFTTYGKGVGIYAWGEGVPLRTPGGMQMRNSGTSMAAPLVARAAASMLAVNPRLRPAQLIAGMTATATTDDAGLKLLHTAAAVQWARSR
jgi:subtilisin family serine protease